MIPYMTYHQFDLEFFAGEFHGQRYGQAFLNHFNYNPQVAQHRGDSVLWEAQNKNVAMTRIRELGIEIQGVSETNY